MTQPSNAIMTTEQAAIEHVTTLANIVLSLRDKVFKDGLDFGLIPGTGTKPTLLLPGMEKLLRALHLRPEYIALSQIEDFDKNRIFYRYECRLIDYDTGLCVSTAIGSANSHESKWRWREQKRLCPRCQKETINRSKFPPKNNPTAEPGWYCYAKAGGCGAEFAVDDKSITEQVVGRIENPDLFDQMNTIDKIAQKRALSSAIKGAANVSEFFTVDLEDFVQYDTVRPVSAGNIVEGTFSEVVSPEQPSASVKGAGVQKPQAPVELGPLGDEDDTPPNVYHVNALLIILTKTATQFILKAGNTRIPVNNMAVFEDVRVGERLVTELRPAEYPVSWVVTADKSGDSWDVQLISESVPA